MTAGFCHRRRGGQPAWGLTAALALAAAVNCPSFADAPAIQSLDEVTELADAQSLLLEAESLAAAGDYAAAMSRIEILERQYPSWPGPRIVKARVLEEMGRFREARTLIASEMDRRPPPHVLDVLKETARRLERKERWRAMASASFISDSNLNNATSRSTIEVFGLPFELDDASRPHDGQGIAFALGVDYRHRPDSAGVFLKGSGISYLEAASTQSLLRIDAGLTKEHRRGRWGAGVRVGPSWVMRNEDVFAAGALVEAQGAYAVSPSWSFAAGANFETVRYRATPDIDVSDVTVRPRLVRRFGEVASAWAGVEFSRRQSSQGALRFSGSGLMGGVEASIGRNLNAAAELGFVRRAFDDPAYVFAGAERQIDYYAAISLRYDRLTVRGFAPQLSLQAVERRTNLPFGDFEKTYWSIGAVRTY